MQRYNTVVGARSVRSTGDFDVPTLMLTTLLYRRPRYRRHGFYSGGGGCPKKQFRGAKLRSYIFTVTILKHTIFNSCFSKK